MTTTDTTSAPAEKKLTIVLSDAPPVRVKRSEWPCIAEAAWFSGQHECRANEVASIRVRQHDGAPENEDVIVPHADGRMVVYGSRDRGPGGMAIGYRGAQAGYVLAPVAGETKVQPSAVVRAIRRVAGVLGMEHLGDECIADLPAEDL